MSSENEDPPAKSTKVKVKGDVEVWREKDNANVQIIHYEDHTPDPTEESNTSSNIVYYVGISAGLAILLAGCLVSFGQQPFSVAHGGWQISSGTVNGILVVAGAALTAMSTWKMLRKER